MSGRPGLEAGATEDRAPGPYRETPPGPPPLPRRGRPALADEVRRGHASTVLLTPSEWDGVREAAAAAGLPPSVYIRRAALFAVRNLRPTVLVDPAVDRG